MRTRSLNVAKTPRVLIVVVLACALVAAATAVSSSLRPPDAKGAGTVPDLSGPWNMTMVPLPALPPCSFTLTQSGSVMSWSGDCGPTQLSGLGTITPSGDVSMTLFTSPFNTILVGTASKDGTSMAGIWAPSVTLPGVGGTFSATKKLPTPTPTPCPGGKVPAVDGCGTPTPTQTPCGPEGCPLVDLNGLWNIDLIGSKLPSCSVTVMQSGTSLSWTGSCGSSIALYATGTILAPGDFTLSGDILGYGTFFIGSASADANSMGGKWDVPSIPISGRFSGTKKVPTSTPTPCPGGKVPATPTGCGTVTPTRTSTPTRTAIPTTTPCPQCSGMSLAAPGMVSVGETFVLSISASPSPNVPIAGFAAEVDFPAGLKWVQETNCFDEIAATRNGGPLAECVRALGPEGQARHVAHTGAQVPPLLAIDAPLHELIEVDVLCNQPGTHDVVLTAEGEAAPFGAIYFDLDADPVRVLTEFYDGRNVADVMTITCSEPPPATATSTAIPNPPIQKVPALSNLFLTNQPGPKIAPTTCAGGTDDAILQEVVWFPITSLDPKGGGFEQELATFEFEVRFDQKLLCVNLEPGPAWEDATCLILDKDTSLLEGIARISCFTPKGEAPGNAGLHLANIIIRPQPEAYSQIRPNQENGIVAQLLNQDCELGDELGHPIAFFSCEDADVTIRFLEGDLDADCDVDVVDGQSQAFRWNAELGNLLYNQWYDLEPSVEPGGINGDGDIDVKDIQFVFGRLGSTCSVPNPPQPPENPKADP